MIKVIIVDDSAIIRAILEQNLKKESDIEIIDSVSNGMKVIDSVKRNKPDIVLSDVNMPGMNGFEATKILSREMKIPVILFLEDSFYAAKAKSVGACDYLIKPNAISYNQSFFTSLLEKIRRYSSESSGKDAFSSTSSFSNNSYSHISSKIFDEKAEQKYRILCIGASTGGPTAVSSVLSGLGKDFPLPILYTQHIEIGADKTMADWFNNTCSNITIQLAKDGQEAFPGNVYMAPADTHLVINFVKTNGHPVISLSNDPPERFLKPAVNKLFRSAASFYGKSCLAILLTGMGRDGAEGCKTIVENGGYTIVEDESTCAVFGMPAAAIEIGGASEILPRFDIANRILELSRRKR
ncbi:MAG: response regulator [Treponema sp.]|nr:response regulator [Treponema sp.]